MVVEEFECGKFKVEVTEESVLAFHHGTLIQTDFRTDALIKAMALEVNSMRRKFQALMEASRAR